MINRRELLEKIILSFTVVAFSPWRLFAQSTSGDDRPLEFQWRVPQAHFETVKNELQFDGKIERENDSKGILIYIFVGAVLLPYLAKAVLALRREIVHGGIVIDTTGEKIDIDTDKSLPSGLIVMRTSEGAQLFERDEISDPAELVGALMKGL
jgi:hypothetical protein